MQTSGGLGSSSGTPDIAKLTARVNRRLVEVHTRRLADLGTDDSGLFDHYATLVRGGAILRSSELTVCRLICETLPRFAEYFVLKAGLGELALLLREVGLPTVACEKNGRRFAALSAGCAGETPEPPEQAGLRLFEEFLPEQIHNRPALAIGIDFAYNLALESDSEFRKRLRQFDALLINPRLFIRVRNSAAEQRAGITFLRSLGFVGITEYPEHELVLAVRPAGQQGHEDTAAWADPVGAEFEGLLERVMNLVPEAPPQDRSTTWVERRIREFDMKSAFGNGE